MHFLHLPNRGCSCPSCTNNANRANYRRQSSHRIHRTHRIFWRKIFSHRFHRYSQIRRVWHPAIPTQPLNYLPTKPYAT